VPANTQDELDDIGDTNEYITRDPIFSDVFSFDYDEEIELLVPGDVLEGEIPDKYVYTDINVEQDLKDGEFLIGFKITEKGGLSFVDDDSEYINLNFCTAVIYSNYEVEHSAGYFDIEKVVAVELNGELKEVKFNSDRSQNTYYFIIKNDKEEEIKEEIDL